MSTFLAMNGYGFYIWSAYGIAALAVVHRSDGSGTTYIWVDFLSKVSKDWKEKVGVGTSVKWPVGLGGKGNEGVSGLVKQTPNSIGYVELIYALQTRMSYGSVKNAAGKFVKANLKSVTAAAAGAARNMPGDFRVSITNPPGEDVYPVASFTWLLTYKEQTDRGKGQALVKFVAGRVAAAGCADRDVRDGAPAQNRGTGRAIGSG